MPSPVLTEPAPESASVGSVRALEREVLLEVHGDRASPTEVESTSLLALASAYFSLLTKTVEHDEDARLLEFTGLRVVDKCVAIGVIVNDEDLAIRTVNQVSPWIGGQADPPRELRAAVIQTREARRALDARQQARLIIGVVSTEIRVASEEPPVEWSSWTRLRARVLRTGGREPKVRFEVRGEPPFSLGASTDLVVRLGHHLYKEVEIVASVTRDGTERILYGTVNDFEPVEESSPEATLAAWRAFHLAAMGLTPQKDDPGNAA